MSSTQGGGKCSAWLRIARLQFYPMTWLAYSLGAVSRMDQSGPFNLRVYLLGYLVLFLIEWCTVLTNEYFDFDSDRQNGNFSIFTGGTRVLVEGRLSFREVRHGIFAGLALIPAAGFLLIRAADAGAQFQILGLITVGLFFGLGYTVPPLKFSYRGAGEIVVGLTHSFYVILCGFVFQGGSWNDPLPWLLSVPLFLAVLAANTVAGIPDLEADRAVRKRSLAVVLGPRNAVRLAILFAGSACLSGLLLGYFHLIPMAPLYWVFPVLPHAAVLLYFLFRLIDLNRFEGRIDGTMGLALSYIIWFGLLPLIAIW